MSQVFPFLNYIVYILVGLIKLAGTLLFGFGMGWLTLEVFKNDPKPWQVQIAFFLGIIALLIALLLYSHLGLGGFCIGMGVAIIMWGIPKPEKKESQPGPEA